MLGLVVRGQIGGQSVWCLWSEKRVRLWEGDLSSRRRDRQDVGLPKQLKMHRQETNKGSLAVRNFSLLYRCFIGIAKKTIYGSSPWLLFFCIFSDKFVYWKICEITLALIDFRTMLARNWCQSQINPQLWGLNFKICFSRGSVSLQNEQRLSLL